MVVGQQVYLEVNWENEAGKVDWRHMVKRLEFWV